MFSVAFEDPTDDISLVCSESQSSRTIFNPLKSSFTDASRRLSAKQRVMFSKENYTVAVVKELKSKVTELGISNL